MDRGTGKKLIIPIFVPHVGCPNTCIFCNQKSISGRVEVPSRDDIVKTISLYLQVAYRYESVELAFFGGSFTAIGKQEQERLLSYVKPFIGKGIDYIRLSTRPDAIGEENLNLLYAHKVRVIELGAQSMDDKVLKASLRGHKAIDTIEASKLIKKKGFSLGLQTMPGLPLSNYESDMESAKEIGKLKPDFVRIYPTIVIRGTGLENLYLKGKYIPPSLEYMISLSADLASFYEGKKIPIARIGLQSSDNLTDEKDYVAGPYHPAFGQLVYQEIYLRQMIKEIEKRNIRGDKILVRVGQKDISTFIGHKKQNIEYLKESFEFSEVKFLVDRRRKKTFHIEEIN